MGSQVWRLSSASEPLLNTTTAPAFGTTASSRITIAHSSTASVTNPNTSTRKTPILTPPPRLHLRNLIAFSPLLTNVVTSNVTVAPTPYPYPMPWLWQCHLCYTTYRLGVTRRCLRDGHYFCAAVVDQPSSPTSPSTAASTNSLRTSACGDEHGEIDEDNGEGIEAGKKARRKIEKERKRKERARKRKRKRRGRRGCRAHFDYEGWRIWNSWRREMRNSILRGKDEIEDEDSRGRRRSRSVSRKRAPSRIREYRQNASWNGSGGDRNCWADCDFPSQCLNERRAEKEWQARVEEMRRLDHEWIEREMDLSLASKLEEENFSASDSAREESVEMDVDSDAESDEHEKDNGNGDKNSNRRSFPGEVEMDLGDDSEVYMAGVGQWYPNSDFDLYGGDDEDGDTIMTDVDMDYESEEDSNAWSDFDPISGNKIRSYSQSHLVPIALAISTDAASSYPPRGERDIDLIATRDNCEHENLGPIGTDCDGLGEVGYQLSYTRGVRRKSIEGLLSESPPHSPLKECSFRFEDLVDGDLGVIVSDDSGAIKKYDQGGDMGDGKMWGKGGCEEEEAEEL